MNIINKKVISYFIILLLCSCSYPKKNEEISGSPLFKYHDNTVKILSNGLDTYKLISGSFEIDDFTVTWRQDPDKHIKKGMVFDFTSKRPSMTFVVGRHGSDTTAENFTKIIPAGKTTFDHSPAKLNFYFIGPLILEISGGVLGKQSMHYTIDDVGIAQGHTGASNNWWFGGKTCTYTKANKVVCTGVNKFGSSAKFTFRRGWNPANEIWLTDVSIDEYKTVSLDSLYTGENTSCKWQTTDVCPPFVWYFDKTELNNTKLTVKNGKLKTSTGKSYNTPSPTKKKKGIFVMDTLGNIYSSPIYKIGILHHSSFLAGKPVAAAGEIRSKNGKITMLNNCSGHYKPSVDVTKQIIEQLYRLGYTGAEFLTVTDNCK